MLSTLGNSASEEIPVEHTFSEHGVLVWRWIRNAPPIPIFAKYGNFQGNVDRLHYYDYQAPSIAVIDFGSADAGVIADPQARDAGLRIFACHFITPVDEHHCIIPGRRVSIDPRISRRQLDSRATLSRFRVRSLARAPRNDSADYCAASVCRVG